MVEEAQYRPRRTSNFPLCFVVVILSVQLRIPSLTPLSPRCALCCAAAAPQGTVYAFLQEFALLGGDAGVRMVVVKLADGTLWVHAPIQLTTELAVMIGGAGGNDWEPAAQPVTARLDLRFT